MKGQGGVPPEEAKDVKDGKVVQMPPAASQQPAAKPAAAPNAAPPAPKANGTGGKTHEPIAFAREFRKHAKTGAVVAVELAGGQLNGVLVLTKPEQMTHGALPVLVLDGDKEAYRKDAGFYEPWEPKHTPESAIAKLGKLSTQLADVDKKINDHKSRVKQLNVTRDSIVADISRTIQAAVTGQKDLLDGVPATPTAETKAATDKVAATTPAASKPAPASLPG